MPVHVVSKINATDINLIPLAPPGQAPVTRTWAQVAAPLARAEALGRVANCATAHAPAPSRKPTPPRAPLFCEPAAWSGPPKPSNKRRTPGAAPTPAAVPGSPTPGVPAPTPGVPVPIPGARALVPGVPAPVPGSPAPSVPASIPSSPAPSAPTAASPASTAMETDPPAAASPSVVPLPDDDDVMEDPAATGAPSPNV